MSGNTSGLLSELASSKCSAAGVDHQLLEHIGRLFDVTRDLLGVMDFDGHYQFLNSSWESVLGYSRGELMAMPHSERVHPDDRAATLADVQKVRAGIPTKAFENRQLCKDGSYKWISWSVAASNADRCFYIAGRDITEHKHSEERILRLAQALSNSNEMICMGDGNGRAVFVNRALLDATGYEEDEVIGKLFDDTLLSPSNPSALAGEIRTQVLSQGKWSGECFQRRKNGSDFPVSLSIGMIRDEHGRATGSFGIAQDITERRRLEQQLRQVQKMEAVGQLAGGIAHDFNNLLMVIMGYAGDMIEHLEVGDPLRRKADEICRAGRRAASLTKQLLAFSRQQVLEPRVLNLNAVVEDLKNMLGRLINEDIRLVAALDPELWKVKADQGQLEQVVINLAVNARDAMPGGGTLTIQTANAEVDEAYARSHSPMSPGPFVRLSVTDTGIGMDTETQSRLFEPFFTTKEQGKGTGLGLATVYGVVKQSGGFIWVTSELGQGARFDIFLPQVRASVQGEVEHSRPDRSWTGTETVLLVEDDEAVRELIADYLRTHGYSVIFAANGVEALQIAREGSGHLDLLLTDVVMPGLSGPQVADGIVALNPATRVLYMSGYSEMSTRHEEILRQGRRLLQKPYTLPDLVRAVREALDATLAHS